MNCKHCDSPFSGNRGTLIAHEKVCRSNTASSYTDELIFVENSTYARQWVKQRILKLNLIEYHCAICRVGPEWLGKPMPLLLDHINGVNNDNRLTNLRFICSNCDSQLPTYKSRNRQRKIKPS